jgi:hypothetical protein
MRLIDTIVGRENIESLPANMQEQARSAATREFWINTILGGKGFASGLQGARQVVPGMQQRLQAQQMEQARQGALVPTGRFIGPQQGSQLSMLRSQMGGDTGMASMLDDPTADAMTTQALVRGGQGTGIAGTGLTQERQLVPEMELDERRFAELASQAMPATQIDSILQNFEKVRPKINEQGVMTDIRGRVIGAIPTFKDGTQTILGPQGFTSAPVQGYRDTQMQNYVPNLPEGAGWAVDAAGNRFAALAPGMPNVLATTGTIRALSEGMGQTEQAVQNGVIGRVPRSSIIGTPQQFLQNMGVIGQQAPQTAPQTAPQVSGQPAQQGVAQPRPAAGARGGFVQSEISPQQQTLNAEAARNFEAAGKQIRERAANSTERLFQSEEVYNAAQRIDPNALTSIAGNLTPWLRLIPGFGDSLAQFGTDFALLRQRHSRGILRQFEGGAAKGNLNDREVRLFQTASWQMNDPKEIIQYIAATEAAMADKDLARLQFFENYIASGGDPAQVNTAWANAPENTRVYDHPMFIRFLTDRVNESFAKPLDKDGKRPMPVLPPGHKLVQNDQGQYGIRNPDGRVIPVGQ